MTDEARDAQEELKGYRAACHALTKLESDMANLRARLASTSRSALDVGIQDNHDLKRDKNSACHAWCRKC